MTRIVAALSVKYTEDLDQLYKLADYQRVLDDSEAGRQAGGLVSLAPNASDIQVLFTPEVTNARYVLVLVRSGEANVKLNSTGAYPIPLAPLPAASAEVLSTYQKTSQPGVLFMGPLTNTTAPLTTLYLSNPSPTVAAEVTVLIVGEAQ